METARGALVVVIAAASSFAAATKSLRHLRSLSACRRRGRSRRSGCRRAVPPSVSVPPYPAPLPCSRRCRPCGSSAPSVGCASGPSSRRHRRRHGPCDDGQCMELASDSPPPPPGAPCTPIAWTRPRRPTRRRRPPIAAGTETWAVRPSPAHTVLACHAGVAAVWLGAGGRAGATTLPSALLSLSTDDCAPGGARRRARGRACIAVRAAARSGESRWSIPGERADALPESAVRATNRTLGGRRLPGALSSSASAVFRRSIFASPCRSAVRRSAAAERARLPQYLER